jgi:hypothetical protein
MMSLIRPTAAEKATMLSHIVRKIFQNNRDMIERLPQA